MRGSPAIHHFNGVLRFGILVDNASTDTHAGIDEIGNDGNELLRRSLIWRAQHYTKTKPKARPS